MLCAICSSRHPQSRHSRPPLRVRTFVIFFVTHIRVDVYTHVRCSGGDAIQCACAPMRLSTPTWYLPCCQPPVAAQDKEDVKDANSKVSPPRVETAVATVKATHFADQATEEAATPAVADTTCHTLKDADSNVVAPTVQGALAKVGRVYCRRPSRYRQDDCGG